MKNNIKLGLFVTIAIVLFLTAIYYIGNRQNLFGERFYISALFEDVKGLQPGNNVRYAGIDAGTVNQIILLNDSAVQVTMVLNEAVRPFIKKDAVAKIGSDGLVGNIIVSISPGTGQSGPVENHDVIASNGGLETEELLNAFGRTNEEVIHLTKNLIAITEKINSGSGTVGVLLRDSLLAQQLQHSITQLNRTTQAAHDIANSLRDVVGRIEEGKGLAGGLLTDTTVMTNLRASSGHFDTLLTTQVEPILADLQATSQTLAAFSTDMERISTELNRGSGPVGALLQDTLMQEDLRATMENINEGTARFSENMEALRHNFFFRRYFRKKDKNAGKN